MIVLHVGSGERDFGGVAREDAATSFCDFHKWLCCVQGGVREAVEELLEQIQRHLFETFVKDCWLRAGSGESGCSGIARADAAPSFRDFRKGLCCVQGMLREAVEELREQMQRHLFETFVKDCVACREW
jgi:hypothetical protein